MSYTDAPTTTLNIQGNMAGQLTEAILNPKIATMDPDQIILAIALHEEAHKLCFIANSLNFPITINPLIFQDL